MPFSIGRQRTAHGLIYTFHAEDKDINFKAIDDAFIRFKDFIDICNNDANKAEEILQNAGITQNEAKFVLSHYVKEYQRLVLDFQREFEMKAVIIRQKLENELLKKDTSNFSLTQEKMQNSTFFELTNSGRSIVRLFMNPTINVRKVNLKKEVTSKIEEALNGDITYTSEDSELIDLFEKHQSPLDVVKLKSELELLKDKTAPSEKRERAMQKIVFFLQKVIVNHENDRVSKLIHYVRCTF